MPPKMPKFGHFLDISLQPSQQRYPQLAGYPRTQEQRNSHQGCKGFESPRLPCSELRWYFDNLGDVHAVDAPSVDGVHSPAVTEAIHLFDLVDGIACHTLREVDTIVDIHAIQAQAVTPLYTGMLHRDKSHLRGAGSEGKGKKREEYDYHHISPAVVVVVHHHCGCVGVSGEELPPPHRLV